MTEIQEEAYSILIEIDRICEKHNIKYRLAFGSLLGAIRHHGFIPWDDDLDIDMTRDEYNKFLDVIDTELSSDFFFQTRQTDKRHYHGFAKIRSNRLEYIEANAAYMNVHRGVWVDIFVYDNIPDASDLREKQRKKLYFLHRSIVNMVYTLATDKDTGLKRIVKKIMMRCNRICYRVNFLLPILCAMREKAYLEYSNVACQDMNILNENHDRASYSKSIQSRASLEAIIKCPFEGQEFPVPKAYDEVLTNLYGDYMTPPPEEECVPTHLTI